MIVFNLIGISAKVTCKFIADIKNGDIFLVVSLGRGLIVPYTINVWEITSITVPLREDF